MGAGGSNLTLSDYDFRSCIICRKHAKPLPYSMQSVPLDFFLRHFTCGNSTILSPNYVGEGGEVIERDDARVRQCLRHFQRVLKCTGFCGAFVTVGGVSLTFYSAKDPLSAFSSVRLCVTLFSGYWNSCMDSVLKWLCVI